MHVRPASRVVVSSVVIDGCRLFTAVRITPGRSTPQCAPDLYMCSCMCSSVPASVPRGEVAVRLESPKDLRATSSKSLGVWGSIMSGELQLLEKSVSACTTLF